jgi:hypothetical protein
MNLIHALPRYESEIYETGKPSPQAEWRKFDLITPDELIPKPHEFVLRNGTPDTIAGRQALAESLLTNQSCVFHRNVEISSRYAWIYKFLPACFKWAGMAAFASHHVRLALFPFRLDRDRTGPAPRARAARLGATQLRSPLVRLRQARLYGRGHELRGA